MPGSTSSSDADRNRGPDEPLCTASARSWWATLALIVLAPLGLAWPLPLVFGTDLLGWRYQEAGVHAWGLWAALVERSPVVVDTKLAAWPDGVRFVLVDPANLPSFALGSLWSVAAGYNLVLYSGLVLAGVGCALLARRAGGAPWLGALVGMACPTLLACTFEGTTEAFVVGWVAIHLALLLGFLDGRGWWWGLGALAALAAAGHAGPYNGVWAGLLDLGVLLAAVVARRWKRAGLTVAVLVGGFFACLPLAWATLTQRLDTMSGSGARAGLPPVWEEERNWRGLLHHGADLLDPWLPMQLTGGRPDMSHTAYLGLATLLFAVVALARNRRLWPWLAGALAFAFLSLGPWLYVRGQAVQLGDGVVMAPAGWLMAAVPSFFGRLTRWDRAGAVASFLLAPLVAQWAVGVGRRVWVTGGAVALVVVADLLLCAPLAWPLHHGPFPDVNPLLALDGVGAVLELPHVTPRPAPGQLGWRDQTTLAQMQHGQPTALTSTLLAAHQPGELVLDATWSLRVAGSVDEDVRARLLEDGFTHLLLHLPFYTQPVKQAHWLAACFGPPVARGEELAVFDLSVDAGGCRAPDRERPSLSPKHVPEGHGPRRLRRPGPQEPDKPASGPPLPRP